MAVPTSTASHLMRSLFVVERFGERVYGESEFLVTVANGSDPLADGSVPDMGDEWNANNPNLKVEERTAKPINTDATNTRYEIRLIYRLQIPSGSEAGISRTGGASLQQKDISVDANGNPIEVAYAPPPGGTLTVQRKQLTVMDPVMNTMREMTIPLPAGFLTPEEYCKTWIGKVNSDTWLGEEPGHWLVTDTSFELVDKSADPRVYRFRFQFETRAAEDGWFYEALWTNSDGSVPSDIVENEGRKIIAWHQGRLFRPTFPD